MLLPELSLLRLTPARRDFVMNPNNNQTTAMVSVLFIILAIIYGILTNRVGLKTGPATVIGIIGIVAALAIGLNCGLAMGRTAWIVIIGVYITVASLIPVWIMLQPRDYLSSFLLYAMMGVAIGGILYLDISKSATFQLPAFTGWTTGIGPLFPALFITVACGACSGFHSLISTGTSSKQLANEAHAKPIGYGSMLIESALGVISLIAVGMISTGYTADLGSPASAFANKEDEATWKDAKGIRKLLAHPLFGTAFMVIIGCVLGGLSLSQIWGLFGSANQLLAGIALMAVCAWLGEVGKNNKMFFIPMAFMLIATLTQLVITVKTKLAVISAL